MSDRCEWREEECTSPKAKKGKKTYSLCWGHLDIVKQNRREIWAQRAEECKARRDEATNILSSAATAGSGATEPTFDDFYSSVVVFPGNTSFAAQAKKFDEWQSIKGGVEKPIGKGAGSLAYAQSYAASLREFGIDARAQAVAAGPIEEPVPF